MGAESAVAFGSTSNRVIWFLLPDEQGPLLIEVGLRGPFGHFGLALVDVPAGAKVAPRGLLWHCEENLLRIRLGE